MLRMITAAAAASLLCLMAAPALAQSPTSTADAKSGSNSNSGAAVFSNPTVNATTGGSSSQNTIRTNQSQSASSNNHVDTSAAQTTTQNPNLTSNTNVISNSKNSLQAPEILISPSNTTSPCVIAASGGVSFPGGSVGLAGGIKDTGCEMRARTELLRSFPNEGTMVAKAYLCNHDPEIRQAFVDVGLSCYPTPDTALTPRAVSENDTKVILRGRVDRKGIVEDVSITQK